MARDLRRPIKIETASLPEFDRDGLEIVRLVLEGARLLAETDHIWASHIPGFMLAEFNALIHWAFARPERAQRLRDALVTYRAVAMHRYGQPSPDVPPIDNLLLHADATTRLICGHPGRRSKDD